MTATVRYVTVEFQPGSKLMSSGTSTLTTEETKMTITCTTCNRKAVVSRWDSGTQCKPCAKVSREQRHAEAARIVSSGKCPQCGSSIRRNSSLSGWYQCSQFGAEGFRADGSKPVCNWQTFTS